MKAFVERFKWFIAGIILACALPVGAQLIYGNTFPFWNVNGPLTVTGTSTLADVAVSSTLAVAGTTTNGLTVISGASNFNLKTTATPLSTAACTPGTLNWDTSYLYFCASSGVVKRLTGAGGW